MSRRPKKPGTRTASGRSRTRTGSPAEFRWWVTKHNPEELEAELLLRIQNLDALAKPLWAPILALTRQLATTTLGTMGVPVDLPQLSAEHDRALARHAVANIAADYWREHEYRPGILLPPIQTVGVPWEVAQDRIHVLDLPPQVIKTAVAATKKPPKFAKASGPNLDDPVTQFHVQVHAALATIRQLGPWALGSTLPLLTLLRCLILARYSPYPDEALMAAQAADALLDALRPNLSRRMTRTPARLTDLQKRIGEIHKAVIAIQDGLVASGPTRELFTRARRQFGATITMDRLRHWQGMDPLPIARQLLARRLRCSDKALRDLLALAERVEEIDGAWTRFVTYVNTLPEDRQRELVTALPLLGMMREPEKPPATTP